MELVPDTDETGSTVQCGQGLRVGQLHFSMFTVCAVYELLLSISKLECLEYQGVE